MLFDLGTASNIAYPLGLGLAAFGGAIGLGMAVSSALSSMARQPEMAGKLLINMIIGAAFIESCVIYVFISYFLLNK